MRRVVIKTFKIKAARRKDDLGFSKEALKDIQVSLLDSFLKALESAFEKDQILPNEINITVKYAIGGNKRED